MVSSSTVHEFGDSLRNTAEKWFRVRCKAASRETHKTLLCHSWTLTMKSSYKSDKTKCPVQIFDELKRAVKCIQFDRSLSWGSDTRTHLQFWTHTKKRKIKAVELFLGLIPFYSDQCPAVPNGTTNGVKLVVSARGIMANIWDFGFRDVLDIVEKRMKEMSLNKNRPMLLLRRVICPFCLTASQNPRDSVCDWDYRSIKFCPIKCALGHQVSSDLLYGFTKIPQGLVLVAIWYNTKNEIEPIGSGFIANKDDGLIIISTRSFFHGNLKSVPEQYQILIGTTPEHSQKSTKFIYTAKLVLQDEKSGICVLQIEEKFTKPLTLEGRMVLTNPSKYHLSNLKSEPISCIYIANEPSSVKSQKIHSYGFPQHHNSNTINLDASISDVTDAFCKTTTSTTFESFNSDEIHLNSGWPCINQDSKVVGILSQHRERNSLIVIPAMKLARILRRAKNQNNKKRIKCMTESIRGVVLIAKWDHHHSTIDPIGSGFFCRESNGMICTAAHNFYDLKAGKVVRRKKDFDDLTIVIGVASGNQAKVKFQYTARILHQSHRWSVDACLLQIDGKIKTPISMFGRHITGKQPSTKHLTLNDIKRENLPCLDIGKKCNIRDKIRVIGFPQENPSLLNKTIDISEATITHTHHLATEHVQNYEEVDMCYNPSSIIYTLGCAEESGKSGGPCLNEENEVIGILSMSNKQGHSSFVPFSALRKLVGNKLKGRVGYRLEQCLEASNNPGTKLDFSGLKFVDDITSILQRESSLFLTLQELDLTNTILLEIPPEAVTKMSVLQTLKICNCRLTELPRKWDLPNLLELNLEGNFLEQLPSLMAISKGSPKLRRINLSNNHLHEFPIGEIVDEDCLSQLEYLDLRENKLQIFPIGMERITSLHTLLLSGNRLRKIPVEICDLNNLRELDVESNPIAEPPMTTCQHGIERIRQYWKYCQDFPDIGGQSNKLPKRHSGSSYLSTPSTSASTVTTYEEACSLCNEETSPKGRRRNSFEYGYRRRRRTWDEISFSSLPKRHSYSNASCVASRPSSRTKGRRRSSGKRIIDGISNKLLNELRALVDSDLDC